MITTGMVDASGERAVAPADVAPAFDDFFVAQYRPLLALATALCGSRAIGEDVVQEAMFAASRQWAKIGHYDDPAQWARGVVARRSSNVRRGRFREAGAVRRLAGWRDAVVTPLPALEGDAFWQAVRALPRRQRECVALHYLDDLTTAEIASTLGIAEPTVRVHLHAARGALAAALTHQLPGETDE
jgi:RNA polymerase sigma-70 factor (ECF subfamily)